MLIRLVAFSSIVLAASACVAQVRVLVDHVGYEANAHKRALIVVEGDDSSVPKSFSLLDAVTGKSLLTGPVETAGAVDRWGDRQFWFVDFSTWKQRGHYVLAVQTIKGHAESCGFEINNDLLERDTLSNVIFYLKSQRASGDIDRADRHLALPGGMVLSMCTEGGTTRRATTGFICRIRTPHRISIRSRCRWWCGRC